MAETDRDRMMQQTQRLMGEGRRAEAREVARQMLMRRPNDADAWRLMAQLVDSPEKAADCYEQLLRINPADEAARDALSRIRSGGEARPDFTPLLRDALMLLRRGRRREAIELVQEILHRDPDHLQAWGVMARLVNEPQKIAECLENILRIDPANAAAQAQLARIRNAAAQRTGPSRGAAPTIVALLILAGLAVLFIVVVLPLLRGG